MQKKYFQRILAGGLSVLLVVSMSGGSFTQAWAAGTSGEASTESGDITTLDDTNNVDGSTNPDSGNGSDNNSGTGDGNTGTGDGSNPGTGDGSGNTGGGDNTGTGDGSNPGTGDNSTTTNPGTGDNSTTTNPGTGDNSTTTNPGTTTPGTTTPTTPTTNTNKTETTKNYATPTVSYTAHIQKKGWAKKASTNGAQAGTTGKKLRLEALKISLTNMPSGLTGGIEYRAHVQKIGWQSWVSNGKVAGTTGKKYRLEAIQIRLTGEVAKYFDVYYRVHVQNLGWMGWAKGGTTRNNTGYAGTSGYSLRVEAIQIKLVKKGAAAPGKTTNTYKAKSSSITKTTSTSSITGNASLDSRLKTLAKKCGGLRACYNWVKNHKHTNWAKGGGVLRYANGTHKLTESFVVSEAARMLDGKKTDCYAFSSAFACLAKALGYDAKVVNGYVPSRSQGWASHSWVEIKQGKTTYVYDADLGRAYPSVNFYAFTYSKAPTKYKKV
jgi:uncharacterized protein YjdB